MSEHQEANRLDDEIIAYGDNSSDWSPVDSGLTRRRFRAHVLGDGTFAKTVLLCAETGLGKTWLSRDLLGNLSEEDVFTQYVSLKGVKADRVARKVMRVSRDVRNATEDPQAKKAVVLDDMPSVEECDLGKVSRAIGRMVAANTLVIVCMLPEAEMLVEELPSARSLSSRDLTAIYQPEIIGTLPNYEVPSGGIASLLFCTGGRSGGKRAINTNLDSFTKALSSLSLAHIRHSLPTEEQQLRLAMLLLGSGSIEVLSSVVPRLDPDSLEWTWRDAPLFGLDKIRGTFCCVGLSDESLFEACIEDFRAICRWFPETTSLSVRALAARGDYTRAMLACTLCETRDQVSIGNAWGVEFVCAGGAAVVKNALQLRAIGFEDVCEMNELAELALAYMCEPVSAFDERPLPQVDDADALRASRRLRLVSLLRTSRDLDRGILPRSRPRQEVTDDKLARTLVTHIQARMLLLSGNLTEAYALLVNNPVRLEANTLVSALLCDDFALAQLLTGESPNAEERQAYTRAKKTLQRSGVTRLASYRELLEPMAMVLVGRMEQIEGVENVIARSARMGDDAIRAILLLTSAIADNRVGAFPRAHVRALQAMEALNNVNSGNLLKTARFVDGLSAYGAGDLKPLMRIAEGTTPSVWKDLSSIFVSEGPDAEVELSCLMRTGCSRDVVWMLNVLSNDFGGRSRMFRQSIPASWSSLSRRTVRKAQAMARENERYGQPLVLGGEAASRKDEGSVSGPSLERERQKPVSIRVLGTFEVRVGDMILGPDGFGKRRTMPFMTLLASTKGHSLFRHELVDSIWPESNYNTGGQRVYEATSTARKLLGCRRGEQDFFAVARGGGSVALNKNLVSVDVDLFERAAHAALSAEEDTRVIEQAQRAIALYGGDIVDTPFDALGLVELRRGELRSLLVDVSVVGASAAMRSDMVQLAVHFARIAYDASGLREDAALALIEALKAAGRVLDAREVYREYAHNLLDETGMPPTVGMRASVGGLFPGLRDGLSGRVGKKRDDVTMTC